MRDECLKAIECMVSFMITHLSADASLHLLLQRGMVKRVGAQPKPRLAKYVLALLLVPLVVALKRDHNARAHVHAGSIPADGHLRQLIEHR